jgi:hypothetical protein
MNFGDFTITKRELLASITIIAILLLIGVWISNGIMDAKLDAVAVYNKAVKIETNDMFEYGMRTNVGNAFVYGDLKAVDTVTYPEIGGEYMYVRKVKERYTMHTRTVTRTRTVNSKTQTYTTVETYWTWDEVDRESKTCEKVMFLDVEFDTSKIDIPGCEYIETIKESSKIRYKYYGTGTEFTGTIFADLRDKTIPDDTSFYKGMTIDQTVEYLKRPSGLVFFWFMWIFLMSGCVYGFYYLDNRWLE